MKSGFRALIATAMLALGALTASPTIAGVL